MASTETSDDLYDYMCIICGCRFQVESECKEHIAADHPVTSGSFCRIPRGYGSKANHRSAKKFRKRPTSKKNKNTNLQPNKRKALPGKEGPHSKSVKTKLLPAKKKEISLSSKKIKRKEKALGQKRKKSDFSGKRKSQTKNVKTPKNEINSSSKEIDVSKRKKTASRKKSNKALIKKGRKTSLVPQRKTKSTAESVTTTKYSKKLSLTKNYETSFLLPPLELMNDHLLHQLSSSESKRVTMTGLGKSESNHDVTVVWSTEELWERNGNADSVTSCYMCYYCRAEFATVGLCRLHIRTNHKNEISTQVSKTNKATLKDTTSRKRKQTYKRTSTDTMMSPDPGGSHANRTSNRLPTIDDLLTLSSCILTFQVWEGEPTPEAEGDETETCDGRDLDGQCVGRCDAVDGSRDGTLHGSNVVARKTYQCSECSQKFPTLGECSKHMIYLHLPTE